MIIEKIDNIWILSILYKINIDNFLKIKDNCQKKSINNYLFDKYFLDLLHPNENEEKRRIYLKD